MSQTDFDQLYERASSGDIQSQFQLAQYFRSQSDFGRARRWLTKAGRNGSGESWLELGLMNYQGLGLAEDIAQARTCFEQASQAGEPGGDYHLAWLHARMEGPDHSSVAQHLTQAARRGYPAALRDYALISAMRSDNQVSNLCLQMAAEKGDVIAQSTLARRYQTGSNIRQDDVAAAYWAEQARQSGAYCYNTLFPSPESDANSRPAPAETIELPLLKLPDFSIDQAAKTDNRDNISVFDGLLSTDECIYLIETTAPWVRPSHTVHPQTGKAVMNEVRTSYGCSFHPSLESPVVLAIKQKLTAKTGMHVQHAEPFAMLRYRPGQEYREHFDFINPEAGEAGYELGTKGQRVITIFCYLNGDLEGGETHFPRRDGIKVRPELGKTVMFYNVNANGDPDMNSLHASLPVVRGEKWLATLWLRSKPLKTI